MKYSELSQLVVWCDGGSRGNGTADAEAYGSFMVTAVSKNGDNELAKHMDRRPYDNLSTNNEAEYQALIDVLSYLTELQHRLGKDKPMDVFLKTDSQLVHDQMLGRAKCKAKNLLPMLAQAKELTDLLPTLTIDLIPGDEMKLILGH